jgi:thiol:disulfide interchange protein DsbD
VRLSQDKFHPGSDALAAVIVEIQQGWHINSSTPADENFIETSLQLKVPKRIEIAHIRYPKGIERNFDFAESPLNVYEGTIDILLELKLASDLKPGSYTIPLLLGYQACSDRVCLAPTTLPADLHLEVVGTDKKTLRINKDLFDGSKEVQKP